MQRLLAATVLALIVAGLTGCVDQAAETASKTHAQTACEAANGIFDAQKPDGQQYDKAAADSAVAEALLADKPESRSPYKELVVAMYRYSAESVPKYGESKEPLYSDSTLGTIDMGDSLGSWYDSRQALMDACDAAGAYGYGMQR